MAKRENDQLENGSRRESIYRGRRIEVVRAPADVRAAGRISASRLSVDGQEIEFEETEDGVMSHQNMFKVYSSPFDLAEDLIKQWGERDIRPADKPHHADHEHDHDHDHGQGHDRKAPDSRPGEGTAGPRGTGGRRTPKRSR